MQLSQSLLDQVLTLANEAGKHLARFYQQDVTIQTNSSGLINLALHRQLRFLMHP